MTSDLSVDMSVIREQLDALLAEEKPENKKARAWTLASRIQSVTNALITAQKKCPEYNLQGLRECKFNPAELCRYVGAIDTMIRKY